MATNPMKFDPSRTGLLRRQFEADMVKRFILLRKRVWAYLATNDALGLGGPIVNAPKRKRSPFQFETNDKKLKKFNAWLKKQVDDGILEISPTTGDPKANKPWLHKYIDSAYKKGAMRAYVDARPALGQPMSYYEGSKAAFLESAFGRPERVDKLRLLYTRAYENLKGITAQMSTQMSRALADGMANGKSPMQIARTMSKTISGMTQQRARVIARTETIHAHAEGQLDGMEDLGVDEVGAEVEWSTAGDDGVCPKCQALEGQVFDVDEARGKIPLHPNCRCAWIPHVRKPKPKRKR